MLTPTYQHKSFGTWGAFANSCL